LNLGCFTGGAGTGTASCTVSYPNPGAVTVTAAYSGDGHWDDNYAPSDSRPVTVTIRDTVRPSRPGRLRGRIAHHALHLSWRASQDNVGVDHYEVYLGNTPLRRVAGTGTQVIVHTFRRHRASVFTLRAFDAAGSRASNAVTARPTRR
jgi:hypothetical protein